jgi:prepilin-type N-terminal cleavage/methylation domain-containing protein/prepilin-type processing-associated H-X9-DG protein
MMNRKGVRTLFCQLSADRVAHDSQKRVLTPFLRRAFTLIELLVVVAIIGVLIGLLLPAVQKVREAANRTTCTNNLKQLGIALHNFECIYRAFPAGCTLRWDQWGWSPHGQLLPFIEQDNLNKQIDFDRGPYDDVNLPALPQRPKIFLCPSDPEQGETQPFGYTNYHPNAGSWVHARNWDGVFGTAIAFEGVPSLVPVRFTEITDGTSNTAAFAEVCNGPGEPASVGPGQRTDCFEFGPELTQDLPTARAAFLARDWRTASYAGGWSPPWRYRGYPWHEGNIWRNWYNHLLPPNRPCWRPNDDWWQLVSPASSWHPGGVNVLLCDGSVRFVRESVDPDAWLAAGTRNGAEAVPLP